MAQTKTQQAERNIRNLGYSIEYCRSPRGNKLCKAIMDGHKTIFATNLISLEKLIPQSLEPADGAYAD